MASFKVFFALFAVVAVSVQAKHEALEDIDSAFGHARSLLRNPLVIKDITKCVEEQRERIAALVEKARETLGVCGGDVIEKLTALFEKAVEEMEAASNNIVKLLDDFEKCTDNACRLNCMKLIAEETFNIQVIIKDIMVEAISIVREAAPEVRECLTAGLEEIRAEARKILEDIKECAANA